VTHPILPLINRRQFLSGIDYNGPGGCWLWKRRLHRKGYAILHTSKHLFAHRVSFAVFRGEPGPCELDHICNVRRCVNPYHLRRATRHQNTVEWSASTLAGINARKSHCIHGHEFTPDNTRTYRRPSGRTYRKCVACQKRTDSERTWP